MKRKILYFAAIAALLSSCAKDNMGIQEAESGIYLSASVPGAEKIVSTKVGEGVSALNENVLKSVYYLLYAKADEEDDPTTALPLLSGHFGGLESETRTTGVMTKRNVPVNASVVNDLFPPGTQTCRAVVVANPTSSLTTVLEGNPSLATLRNSLVVANFTEATAQSDFVMVYDEMVNLTGRLDKTVMEIDARLKRLADKITIEATVADGFYDKTSGWYVPLCEGMKVTLCNGFSKANLAAKFSSIVKEDSDWFDSAEIGFTEAVHGTGADTTYHCSSAFPIYTYPMEWDFEDRHEPVLLFELPWQNTGAEKVPGIGRIQSFYYKIILSNKKMDANSWYNFHVTLKILGSPNKVEPTQQYLYEEYQINDWVDAFVGDYNNVDADIREARYLMVNETNFVLNNQPTWNIPFASSHECEIVDATYYRTNFAVTPPVQSSPASISGLNPECTISISGNVITFSKQLRNDITAGKGNYDYLPYYFTFTLRHKDNHAYSEEITVVQYPALYIDATTNSSGTTVTSPRTNTTTYVNNNANGPTGTVTIDNLGGTTTGNAASNKNGTMYIVSVSALPNVSNYKIMDPRTDEVDLKLYNGNNWSVSAPALYNGGTNRRLTYYYPTASDVLHENAIAPEFRIASSWGACQQMTYDNAVRRCASYQEDGYPAGRWRIPTRAEVEFMIQLSMDEAIPQLFSEDTKYDYSTFYYWCASGVIYPWNDHTFDFKDFTQANSVDTRTGNNKNTHAVRCVYDEWYWKNTDADVTNATYPTTNGRVSSTYYKTFLWGDMPR